MHPQPPVLGPEIGMVGAPGAARVREHQDALLVLHERLGLGEIGGDGAALDRKAVALAHDAPRASGNLRHLVCAEALHDLVERALHRRQRRELLDQAVAAFNGLTALHRLAVAHDRPRGQIAVIVRERLEQLGREGMREIVEHIFARRDVDRNVAPFLRRNFGEAALHQRLAGRDDLDDGRMPGREIAVDGRDQGRGFHRRDQVVEEALLCALEGRTRGGLRLRVPPEPVMLVALSAASRLL
jgi:hypothetical protein